MKRVRVFISGNIQGIFFRAFVNRKAHYLKLKGWVKNLDDGRIEAVFEGTEVSVNEMLELCNRGPVAAKVDGVEYKEEPFKGETGFKLIY